MRARFWLIVSIAFNLFLAAFLYVATEPLKEASVPVAPALENVIVKTNVVVRRENFTWDQVQATNFPTLIKNLRAIGCPEQIIRDIVVSDISRIYARRRVTEVNFPNYQWWKSTPDPAVAQEAEDKLRSLETERRELLTSLLGAGWETESKETLAARAGITLTGPILGDLSAVAKLAALDIIAAGQRKIEAYQEQQRLAGLEVDPMQMVKLREQPLATLASVLPADAYEEFALRYSPAAQQLREMTRAMDLTPDQFRELYTGLNNIIGQPVYFYTGTDASLVNQQQQLATQAESVFKSTLGAAYATYQQNQDPAYQSSAALAQQLNLPATMIQPLSQIYKTTDAELDRIRKDATLSNDEKIEALSQTRVQEEQTLEQLMGPVAFQRWLQSQGQK